MDFRFFVSALSDLEAGELFMLLNARLNPASKNSVSAENAEPAAIKLCDYLETFWDYNNSPYLIEERAYGRSISQLHCKESRKLVKRYWRSYFGSDFLVQNLTPVKLEDFFLHLKIKFSLSCSTVNHVIAAASRAFYYLERHEKIKNNPFKHITRFCCIPLKRGIPSEKEICRLIALDWNNEPCYEAFNLAALYGLRAGEISALRVNDLDCQNKILYIRHSWNNIDGLKATKNSESRRIPIEKKCCETLLALAKKNPCYSKDSFIFWSEKDSNQPIPPAHYTRIFYAALKRIGITASERKNRNIVFHSLRHFCATILSEKTDLKNVQEILGHKTAAMSAHYSDHETMESVAQMKRALTESHEYLANYSA